MSSLPLGLNRIKIERSLTTSALAVFVPFVTQELFMGGDAMYYGLNALSNNMILTGPQTVQKPQRAGVRHAGQRQVHELQAGDHFHHPDHKR